MIIFIICSFAKPESTSDGVITLKADNTAIAITKVNPGPTISKNRDIIMNRSTRRTSIESKSSILCK